MHTFAQLQTESMVPLGASETETCYAVMMRDNDHEVLLCPDGDFFRVPMVEIPRRQRVAPHLLLAVHERYGLAAICRFSFPIGDLGISERCVVLEVPADQPLNDSCAWISTRDICWESIRPDLARDALWRAIARATSYNAGQVPGRFVRPGWLTEVVNWASHSLPQHGVKLRGSWAQYNMGPDYSLIRFGTDRGDVWFKAVGSAGSREFSITRWLAALDLPHLALFLGAREDWHAWLMLGCSGSPLDGAAGWIEWIIAARGLAELQIASIPHCQTLVQAGCIELRTQVLYQAIEPFLGQIAVLMEHQRTNTQRRLGVSDLLLIEKRVKACCRELDLLELPESLGHSDLNSGNVLIDGNGPVFLDWMQGHVGHPLLSFEYLLALNRRLGTGNELLIAAMRREYLAIWKHLCAARQLERACQLMPLVAPFAYGMSCHDLRNGVHDMAPELAALLRSLARRMHVAAGSLELNSRGRSSEDRAGAAAESAGACASLPHFGAGESFSRNLKVSDPEGSRSENPKKGGDHDGVQQT